MGEDENLRPYYDTLVAADEFYGSTDRFCAAQHAYIETPEATSGDRHVFLDMLVAQRQGLFFKIPEEWVEELKLWRLTVFAGAGNYLAEVAQPLKAGGRVARHVVTALVNGLNRIFTGLLVASERELLLATSLSFSSARVSQLLEDRIAVAPRGRPEKVDVTLRRGFPHLDVHLPNGELRSLRLNLTRYEFLMRVSEGALRVGAMRTFCLSRAPCSLRRPEIAKIRITTRPNFHFGLSLDGTGHPIDDVLEVAGV